MRRKHDAHEDGLEGVAQRLRKERPEASPLELDRIKTTAMSRARASTGTRVGARRLAIAGLTVGLLAATTGGVIAGQGSEHPGGNAAVAQYGNNCDTNNNNGNVGSENGNGTNNENCNENSFNETTNNINETTNSTVNNTTNNYGGTNVTNNYTTVSATPGSGVLASGTARKPTTSTRHIKIHVDVPHGARLARVTVRVNGKRVRTLRGKQASANVELVDLPCTTGATTVEVSVTLSNGRTVTARHKYHLCVA